MKLILFLGAGVSVPSGLPLASDLTAEILERRKTDDGEAVRVRKFLNVLKEHDAADIKRVGLWRSKDGYESTGAIYRKGAPTYEDLFFLCQQITLWNTGLSCHSQTTPFMECLEKKAWKLLYNEGWDARIYELSHLGKQAGRFIESVVTDTLRRSYVKGFDLLLELAIARDIDQLNIVTLNHDTLVEQFLAQHDVEFVDGFGEPDGEIRWSDDRVYDDKDARVRLLKLHGSINWFSFLRDGKHHPAISTGSQPGRARNAVGDNMSAGSAKPSFLSGIDKSVSYNGGIYTDMHFRFSELLRMSDRMIMSGYGWGDTAINFQLDKWLDRSRGNRLVLLHENPTDLVDRSLIMANGFNGWIRSGQLTCVERWLSDVLKADIGDLLA